MEQRTNLGQGAWMSAQVVGDGPPVVLIHGIPGSAAVWKAVVAQLAPGHRVVVPDLIGFGASSRSHSIEELWADSQARALDALLDDLGVRQAVVVGHDFGGPVAAHLMAIAPHRISGLVLAATNAFGDTPIPFPLSGIFYPVVGRIWQRLIFAPPSLRMMLRQGVGKGATQLDPAKYVGDPSQARAIATIFAAALHELAERYRPITNVLASARVATKVVWGDRDPFFPLAAGERTASLIAGAQLVVLPGAGHFLPEERPRELAEATRALTRS